MFPAIIRSAVGCALLLVMFAGCGKPAPATMFPVDSLPAALWPALPDARAAAGLTETLLEGRATLDCSPGAVDAATALDLNGAGGFEWAVYGFDLAGNPPDSLAILLDSTAGAAYIGLANFDDNRWEISGPYTAGKTFAIDAAKYIAPSDKLYCFVASYSGDTTVNALSVRTFKPNNVPPTATLSASVTAGDAPLAVEFTVTASDSDGQLIEYAWDWDGDGTYDAVTDGPVITHTFTAPGSFTTKVRVTDDQFGRATDTETISVNVQGNSLPAAVLTATPASGDAPLTVVLDASGSTDADGTIDNYEWDFNGDGLYDGYGQIGSHTQVYAALGTFNAVVRVTDDDGAQAIASVTLTIRGWGTPSSFGGGAATGFTSLALVNGKPAVSYARSGLSYVRASAADGSAWGTPLIVESGNGKENISLKVVNGNPALSYYDGLNGDLKYVRASDADGTTWGAPLILDSTGNVGAWTSLAVVNGKPAISYQDYTNGDLKYVRASDADGSVWGTPQTPDSPGNVGYFTSLAVVNGFPAISYYDGSAAYLKFVRATNAAGSTWGTPQTIDSAGSVGVHTSLTVVSGFPAISYYDISNGDLKFVRAGDADGSTWNAAQVPDSAGNVGQYSSLAIIGGQPAISYLDQTNGNLKYVRASNADGSAWDAPQTADGLGAVGSYTSLALINGVPAISYWDSTYYAVSYVTMY